jgi:hypothetical protein
MGIAPGYIRITILKYGLPGVHLRLSLVGGDTNQGVRRGRCLTAYFQRDNFKCTRCR